MNNEDIVNFIESLDDKQRKQFEKAFKTIGNSMGVEVKEEEQDAPINNVNEDFTVTRENKLSRKKRAVKAGKNQWVDDGTASPHDPEFDPKRFESIGRADRRRPQTKKVEKTCHICGKRFKINPNLVYGENIRCDRCVGR